MQFLTFLWASKVMKNQGSLGTQPIQKGRGSIPDLTSQTALHACLQDLMPCKSVCDVTSRIDPRPSLAQSCDI